MKLFNATPSKIHRVQYVGKRASKKNLHSQQNVITKGMRMWICYKFRHFWLSFCAFVAKTTSVSSNHVMPRRCDTFIVTGVMANIPVQNVWPRNLQIRNSYYFSANVLSRQNLPVSFQLGSCRTSFFLLLIIYAVWLSFLIIAIFLSSYLVLDVCDDFVYSVAKSVSLLGLWCICHRGCQRPTQACVISAKP